jgi:hypothetical protein
LPGLTKGNWFWQRFCTSIYKQDGSGIYFRVLEKGGEKNILKYFAIIADNKTKKKKVIM